mmetsp:Transcript_14744/g.28010  ORF Transcript_14744/g.28010 Transcript_14744/m.28010 type:complete len:368 (+) Transcript_14744:176-1279(+)
MLLARCAEALQQFSYKHVAVETYGPFAATFSEGAIMLYTIGNMIGRQIILGDLLPPLVQIFLGLDSLFAQRWFVMVSITFFVLIPVSLSPYIDSLKWSSLFGLMCMCYVVVLFIAYFCHGLATSSIALQESRMVNPSLLGLMAFPLLVVSFTAHYNTMDMYWELKRRSIPRMSTVVSSSTGICLAVYIIVGTTGYLLFMDETQPNILVNFWVDRSQPPNMFVATAFAAISLAVSFSFPLVCHGARNSVKKLFFASQFRKIDDGGAAENVGHIAITATIILLSLFVGLGVPDIGVVFAFMGSTVGVCFVYILPALFYIKVVEIVRTQALEADLKRHVSTAGAWGLIAFGVFIGLVGTVATSLHVANVI